MMAHRGARPVLLLDEGGRLAVPPRRAILLPWETPLRPWSLLDVKNIIGSDLFVASSMMEFLRGELMMKANLDEAIPKERADGFRNWVTVVQGYVAPLGLASALAQVYRMNVRLEHSDGLTWRDFLGLLEELINRTQDDLANISLFFVHSDRVKFLDKLPPFGNEVFERFPSAIADIEEASKCLAFERPTATVFHLMRAMESVLHVTAKALRIPYAPSWESYLTQIQDRIAKKWRTKGIKWKKDEPFFKDVLAHLQAVKVAWRNPTMHIVKSYNIEQAEEVFNAVRALMRHLATRLSE